MRPDFEERSSILESPWGDQCKHHSERVAGQGPMFSGPPPWILQPGASFSDPPRFDFRAGDCFTMSDRAASPGLQPTVASADLEIHQPLSYSPRGSLSRGQDILDQSTCTASRKEPGSTFRKMEERRNGSLEVGPVGAAGGEVKSKQPSMTSQQNEPHVKMTAIGRLSQQISNLSLTAVKTPEKKTYCPTHYQYDTCFAKSKVHQPSQTIPSASSAPPRTASPPLIASSLPLHPRKAVRTTQPKSLANSDNIAMATPAQTSCAAPTHFLDFVERQRATHSTDTHSTEPEESQSQREHREYLQRMADRERVLREKCQWLKEENLRRIKREAERAEGRSGDGKGDGSNSAATVHTQSKSKSGDAVEQPAKPSELNTPKTAPEHKTALMERVRSWQAATSVAASSLYGPGPSTAVPRAKLSSTPYSNITVDPSLLTIRPKAPDNSDPTTQREQVKVKEADSPTPPNASMVVSPDPTPDVTAPSTFPDTSNTTATTTPQPKASSRIRGFIKLVAPTRTQKGKDEGAVNTGEKWDTVDLSDDDEGWEKVSGEEEGEWEVVCAGRGGDVRSEE